MATPIHCDNCNRFLHNASWGNEPCGALCHDCSNRFGGMKGYRHKLQERAADLEWCAAGQPDNVPSRIFWDAAACKLNFDQPL